MFNFTIIKIHSYGDIELCYKGEWFEYDSFSNKSYRLTDGSKVSSPNGKLIKKRISNEYFQEVKELTEKFLQNNK